MGGGLRPPARAAGQTCETVGWDFVWVGSPQKGRYIVERNRAWNGMVALMAIACLALVAAGPTAAQTSEDATILVTDVGQGNNAKIIRMLLKKSGIENVKLVELATIDDLDGIEMLIVGVGASTKGLGAAGLDVEAESQRAAELLTAADEQSIRVVGVHIGGKPRRGEISDSLNELVLNGSDVFVAWSDGNEDGFFTKLVETRLGDGATEAAVAELLHVVESKRAVGVELKTIIESP